MKDRINALKVLLPPAEVVNNPEVLTNKAMQAQILANPRKASLAPAITGLHAARQAGKALTQATRHGFFAQAVLGEMAATVALAKTAVG
eukprot:9122433-Alexandrium_andersonii.AAC.1